VPEYFKGQFLNRDGEIGNFVMVYPSVGLSDGEKSIAFKNDVGKVELDSGETFYAASTSIIAAEMLELMRKESPWMVGATFLMVFILMLVSFRSLRWAIIAMLPLTVGLLWLFGIMMLTGIMFNFYNLVVLPAILGIGEDNGVHLAHRYREEGKSSMWDVLSSTGQHVTIGSLTTMLGFSGLLFTNHPGLQSIGEMAVVGIGMTLVAALTFLPALIQWLEDRNWIRF
jgi:predicted RND superfamily exporter protein